MSILNNGIAGRTLYRIQHPPVKGGLTFDSTDESTTLLECGHAVKVKNLFQTDTPWCPICLARKSIVE